MAHFALINKEGLVIHVSVVDNLKLIDDSGNEQESFGISHLEKVHRGRTKWPNDAGGFYSDDELYWKQTSYNAKDGEGLRKNYAGKGFVFNKELDAFIPPKPEAKDDYILNEAKANWEVKSKEK